MLSNNNYKITFRIICIAITILFVFHISNDLDLNILYFVNVSALENTDNDEEKNDFDYIFSPSEYFEEDNFPSQNTIVNSNKNQNKVNQME